MKKYFTTLLLFLCLATPSFCEEFTLGMIQQRIHQGMSQAEVVTCLGSPNLVTKNMEGCETWVYDKKSQSTKEIYNRKWYFLFLKGRRNGCKSTEISQKAITVTLNFGLNSCLESFSYSSTDF